MNQSITGSDRTSFIVLALIAVVLSAIIIIAAGFIGDRLVKGDLVAFMTLVIEIIREREPRPISVRMTEVRKAVKALEQAYRAKHGIALLDDEVDSEFEKRKGSITEKAKEAEESGDLPPVEPSFIHTDGIVVEESEIHHRKTDTDDE